MNNKILIIEDDISIASLQKDYLEINDMDVSIETDGLSGYQRAINEDFDLIIVDIMLPSMDGFEICKNIRSQKQTPIMIVSAKSEDIDKIRGLGLGADDYMIKPFSPNELVARVKAHINRYQSLIKPKDDTKILTSSYLEVDLQSHKVFVESQEVIFTHMEFKLLSFLMQHPNQVFSKEELLEKLWGFEAFDSEVSTVVVHIKRIREKIYSDHYDNPIETIWGSGYRFNH